MRNGFKDLIDRITQGAYNARIKRVLALTLSVALIFTSFKFDWWALGSEANFEVPGVSDYLQDAKQADLTDNGSSSDVVSGDGSNEPVSDVQNDFETDLDNADYDDSNDDESSDYTDDSVDYDSAEDFNDPDDYDGSDDFEDTDDYDDTDDYEDSDDYDDDDTDSDYDEDEEGELGDEYEELEDANDDSGILTLSAHSTDNNIQVTATAEDGVLPEDTKLTVEDVEDEYVLDCIDGRVKNITGITAVDINFEDEDGEEVEPSDRVKITITDSDPAKGSRRMLVHIKDDDSAYQVSEDYIERMEDGNVIFNASDFSVYALLSIDDNPGSETVASDTEAEDQTVSDNESEEDQTIAAAAGSDAASEISAPAQDIISADSADGIVHVTARGVADAFPAGTTLNVSTVSPQTVIDAIDGRVRNMIGISAADITFTDSQGQKVQPNKEIEIAFAIEDPVEGTRYIMVHVDDEGNAYKLADESIKSISESIAIFNASSFSTYALVSIDDSLETAAASETNDSNETAADTNKAAGEDSSSDTVDKDSEASSDADSENAAGENENAEGTKTAEEAAAVSMPAGSRNVTTPAGVRVSTSYSENVFPENVTMNVTDIPKESVIDVVNEAVQGEVTDAAAVDITFTDAEGNEIQPAEGGQVQVKLSLGEKLEQGDQTVVHIADNGQATELTENDIQKANEKGATFTAEEFSVYVILTENYVRTYLNYKLVQSEDGSNTITKVDTTGTKLTKGANKSNQPGNEVYTIFKSSAGRNQVEKPKTVTLKYNIEAGANSTSIVKFYSNLTNENDYKTGTKSSEEYTYDINTGITKDTDGNFVGADGADPSANPPKYQHPMTITHTVDFPSDFTVGYGEYYAVVVEISESGDPSTLATDIEYGSIEYYSGITTDDSSNNIKVGDSQSCGFPGGCMQVEYGISSASPSDMKIRVNGKELEDGKNIYLDVNDIEDKSVKLTIADNDKWDVTYSVNGDAVQFDSDHENVSSDKAVKLSANKLGKNTITATVGTESVTADVYVYSASITATYGDEAATAELQLGSSTYAESTEYALTPNAISGDAGTVLEITMTSHSDATKDFSITREVKIAPKEFEKGNNPVFVIGSNGTVTVDGNITDNKMGPLREEDYELEALLQKKQIDGSGNLTYYVQLTPKGNYTGSPVIYNNNGDGYLSGNSDLSVLLADDIEISDDLLYTFLGDTLNDAYKNVKPKFKYTYYEGDVEKTGEIPDALYNKLSLDWGKDRSVGKHPLTVTGKDGSGLYNSKTFEYEIKARPFENVTNKSVFSIELTDPVKTNVDVSYAEYTGQQIKPGVNLTWALWDDDAGKAKTKEYIIPSEGNEDFTLAYGSNTDIGTDNSVTISGVNFDGSLVGKFSILDDNPCGG